MKALGYGKYAIASKYINYALLATVGGSILGILIGEKILPYIIITAYGIMYHNMARYAIASKYINYALLATVGGSILGILIGEKILPYIIITAYGIMYHNMASNLQIHYEFQFAMIASGAAIFCTIGATLFSCYRALVETPASLMRPPAPNSSLP